jgi:NAD(P)-dependent dehydrogenase (short-subunit alcohol dehydrogenase family)
MKKQALLLIGASGGVGSALLEYLAPRTSLTCIPTFYKNKPTDSSFTWLHFDSLDLDSIRPMLKEISNNYEISLVIDVSGAFFASKLQKSTATEISRVISINLVAPILLAKSAQEFLAPAGKIVFMSSILSTMSLVGSSAYAASKAGLERVIQSLALEFTQSSHAICGIRLGYMDYGMTYMLDEKLRRDLLDNLPQEEFIHISVLGDLILKIMNSEASIINGKLYETT